MELIKQWALGITVAAIAGAVILVLSPQGATEKIVRTAVSLFLLCAMLTPFMKSIDIDSLLEIEKINPEANTADIQSGITQSTQQAVREKIEEILASSGIKAEEINIDISIDEEKQMRIDAVTVKLNKSDIEKQTQIREKLKSELGIEVKTEVDE